MCGLFKCSQFNFDDLPRFFAGKSGQSNQCNTLAMAPPANSSEMASISVESGRSCVTLADFVHHSFIRFCRKRTRLQRRE